MPDSFFGQHAGHYNGVYADSSNPYVQQFLARYGEKDWGREIPDANNRASTGIYVVGQGVPQYRNNPIDEGWAGDTSRVLYFDKDGKPTDKPDPNGTYVIEAGNVNGDKIKDMQNRDSNTEQRQDWQGAARFLPAVVALAVGQPEFLASILGEEGAAAFIAELEAGGLSFADLPQLESVLGNIPEMSALPDLAGLESFGGSLPGLDLLGPGDGLSNAFQGMTLDPTSTSSYWDQFVNQFPVPNAEEALGAGPYPETFANTAWTPESAPGGGLWDTISSYGSNLVDKLPALAGAARYLLPTGGYKPSGGGGMPGVGGSGSSSSGGGGAGFGPAGGGGGQGLGGTDYKKLLPLLSLTEYLGGRK